jgi:D-alanine-D-alanine ligase
MTKRVAVLMGGPSAEREVSLTSGAACAAAIRELGHEAVEIDPVLGEDGLVELVRALTPKPDLVFNALHGRWGEDGRVQGLLDLLGVPYTHSGLLASALAMDKPMAKRVFAAAGLRVPGGRVVPRAELAAGDPMPRPYVAKPLNEGSSVGVCIVQPGDNARPIDPDAWGFGSHVLVEPFVAGHELTVGVMGERALAVTELRPLQGFYDYTAKYTAGKTEHLIPAPVPPAVEAAALDTAVRAHAALGCRGVSRSDFRWDPAGGVEGLYLLEVNTQPGMTPLSLVPEQAAHVGMSFTELVGWMLEHAACD